MNIRALILLTATLPIAGCQTTQETSDVDRQAQILKAVPSNYRQVVPLALRQSLPDLSQTQGAEISAPLLGLITTSADVEVPLVCVRLGSSAATGASTSSQTVALAFNDGLFVNSERNSPACAAVAYGPFPELRAAFGTPALSTT